MLNNDRIRLMTKLASYEQQEGKEDLPMSQYYRQDYVGLQMIRTFIFSTIAFAGIAALWFLYHIDQLNVILYESNYTALIMKVVILYVIFIIAYQLIAWTVYTIRYRKAKTRLKGYKARLKKLEKLFPQEPEETK